MLLRRCAWHKQYRGYGRLLGVSSWRGNGIKFSDGMCAECAARTRAAWRLPSASLVSAPRVGIPWATAAVSLATAAVVFGIVVSPVKQALSPVSTDTTVAVVVPAAPRPAAPDVVLEVPVPEVVVPQPVVATVQPAPGFAAADKRGHASASPRSVGHRVSMARGRFVQTDRLPLEAETLPPTLAEVDAEYSHGVAMAPAAVVEEHVPAALPQSVASRPIETQQAP